MNLQKVRGGKERHKKTTLQLLRIPITYAIHHVFPFKFLALLAHQVV